MRSTVSRTRIVIGLLCTAGTGALPPRRTRLRASMPGAGLTPPRPKRSIGPETRDPQISTSLLIRERAYPPNGADCKRGSLVWPGL